MSPSIKMFSSIFNSASNLAQISKHCPKAIQYYFMLHLKAISDFIYLSIHLHLIKQFEHNKYCLKKLNVLGMDLQYSNLYEKWYKKLYSK